MTAPALETPMRRTIIESPFAPPQGARPEHRDLWLELHAWYCRAALSDSLARGEAPFASHALYTLPGVLDDAVPAERRRGMEAGFAWGEAADQVAVYLDLGVSQGMLEGCEHAEAAGLPREARHISGWRDKLPEHLATFLDAMPEADRPRAPWGPPQALRLSPEGAHRMAEFHPAHAW